MKRRDLLKMTSAALATSGMQALGMGNSQCGSNTLAPLPKPRNLLFIITDQQRRDTLAAYGNTQIKVPNLNRLASQSVVFDACYCTQPICTPSRSALLTGLWPHTNGEYTNNRVLDSEIPVLPQMLPKNKYRTAYFGKWHLGNEIYRQRGFDEFESTEDVYANFFKADVEGTDYDRKYSGYHRFLVEHGIKPDAQGNFTRAFENTVPENLSKPAYLAHMATRFLDKQDKEPWVMYVSFLDPHTPFTSAFDKMYRPEDMTVPANFDQPTSATELDRTKIIRGALEKSNSPETSMVPDDQALRATKARYWGKVSLVDTMVGKIMEKLREKGYAEDTVVVFTTDHGEMMGDHHLLYKSVMYEEATRIPMLLKIPGTLSGTRVPQPVSHIDVVPTLLDLLQEEIPAHLQGTSWAPYLRTGESIPERPVMIEWSGPPAPFKGNEDAEPLRAIRTTDGWKMTIASDGEGELYNLKTDPKEMHNVFYEEESLARIQKLVSEMNLWQKATGDTVMHFDHNDWMERRKKYAQSM